MRFVINFFAKRHKKQLSRTVEQDQAEDAVSKLERLSFNAPPKWGRRGYFRKEDYLVVTDTRSLKERGYC